MSPILEKRREIEKRLLEFALATEEGLTVNMISEKLDVSYNVILGMMTEYVAKDLFRLEIVGAIHIRVFFPDKEKIKKEMLAVVR